MCIVSALMDYGNRKWNDVLERSQQPVPPVPNPLYPPPTPPAFPTQEEMDDFRQLLEKAKEFDKKHGEPECELEEKKETLRRLAEQMGVAIEFP